MSWGSEVLLILVRWNKLVKGFFNEKKSKFAISKIPDIYVSRSVGSRLTRRDTLGAAGWVQQDGWSYRCIDASLQVILHRHGACQDPENTTPRNTLPL